MVFASALAACGAQQPEQVDAPAAAAPRMDFAARSRVPVRLDMRATADGGRVAPFAGGYRVDVEFDGAMKTRCAVSRGELPEIAPGSSHEVALRCKDALSLPEGGSRAFRLVEDGREVGSGVVLP
jgi:translation elongation factor EF-Tu-like GTPase